MRLELPWPDKALSPNARTHWTRRAAAVKKARRLAYLTMLEAANHRAQETIEGYAGRIHLWITFHPKTRRLPDDDNCLSMFKAYRDGIADALGIDDKRFVSHPFVSDKPMTGGLVVVRLSRGADDS
jgi:hypothetical protein